MLDVLVIAPHPDDAELGMGGAIAKFVSEGVKVGILDLTDGEPTPHGSPEIRAAETGGRDGRAAGFLGARTLVCGIDFWKTRWKRGANWRA